MKRIYVVYILTAIMLSVSSCKKDEGSERFRLLTGHIWQSYELLVDGEDASGVGQPLEKFDGDAEFRKDGTGTFGQYEGTWYFSNNENNITIVSTDLLVPLTTTIEELTSLSFIISTSFPITGNPEEPNLIKISFRAKP
ncbi:MAG: hypothetical protein IH591_01850 [Bacteroidales bacterium]|nr:hypothetical protein [Bacteroidales bacterium]